MTMHVVLLTDAHEAPALALIEALQEAGLPALIEGMREVEVATTVALQQAGHFVSGTDGTLPLAVLYEVVGGTDSMELRAAIKHATLTWPGVPVVACRRDTNNGRVAVPHHGLPDSATLKRLGFRAVADRPAQLPALLRELEARGTTGELQLPPHIESLTEPSVSLLPAGLPAYKLRAAFELVASLHFTGDQKSAADTALAGFAPLVSADRWTIYLTSETSGAEPATLEPLAVRGLTASEREVPEGDWRRTLGGDTLILSGMESKAALEAVGTLEIVRKSQKKRRFLAAPLTSGERVIGVLEAVREGADQRSFTKGDAALLGALASPIAYALANAVRIAEAERLSQTDDLTKLHNARYLRHFLVGEVKRARRYGSNLTVLFLDLDDFKSINDMHGHLVGSHVLMEMAAVILASVRDTDIVVRYGGDEFVIILPESSIEQAAIVAERVREKIARHTFTGGRRLNLQLTASFGIAAFPQHASSPQQLVASADAAMYEAKAARKNCVRFATSPAQILPAKDEKAIS